MGLHFPAALYLPQDAFDVASNQVIGRRIAGRLLTRAFAANLQDDEMLTVFSPGQQAVPAVNQLVASVMPSASAVRVGGEPDAAVVSEIGAIHFPDPSLGRWAALRQGMHPTAFSLTGVIHTVCSDGALKGLGEIPLAPLYPWDAVVCTSTAGRAVVASALEQRLEAMLARFRLDSPPPLAIDLPQLPVIPLAGPTEQPYRPELTRLERRQHARQQLGVAQDAFVVVFVGRLSFHSKCHPISLYRALDELAGAHPDQSITLIECGHLFNSWIAGAYQELRSRFPRVNFRLIGGLQPADEIAKWQVLAAADVFTSPADNLQETFGLSLLEAMMAELPLVVTDWNGYRDLVRDGVNGFLVPTLDILSDSSSADELDLAYADGRLNYDQMIGLRSLGVIVDHRAYVQAFGALLRDPLQRSAMAASALEVLQQKFSPAAVTSAYRCLWNDLAECRRSASDTWRSVDALPALLPSYQRLFAHYPTAGFACSEAGSFVLNCAIEEARELLCSAMNQQQLQRLMGGRLDLVLQVLNSSPELSERTLIELGLSVGQSRKALAALCKLGLLDCVR